MLFSTWLSNWKRSLERQSSRKQTHGRNSAARRLSRQLRLEALEDRWLLSASMLALSGLPTTITAGAAWTLTVTAKDVNGNIATDYAGTVHFASSDSQAVLPADYKFTAGDEGMHTFTVEFQTTGDKTLTVTDTANSAITGGRGVMTAFAVPTPSSPGTIVSGPDGNLWFTEEFDNKIGRITPSGVVTEFPVPDAGGLLFGITAGPDGNLWFADPGSNQIGRITPTGEISEFAIPSSGARPTSLVTGPDGNVWFCEAGIGKVAKITPDGVITEYSTPSGGYLNGITTGPDGNIWFTEYDADKIGRITPTGTVTEFALPGSSGQPNLITTGPDGNLWFTERGGQIGRISTSGALTYFPTGGGDPFGITVGADGNIWFTELSTSQLARITPSGVITTYAIPDSGSSPYGVTSGPDGNLWFAEQSASRVVRFSPEITVTPRQSDVTTLSASANPSLLSQAVTFTANVSPAIAGSTPTGTVQFLVDGVNAGTPVTLNGGSASFTTSNLAVGSHTVTAIYSGDNFFLDSSGTLTQQVDYKFSGFLPPLSNGLAFAVNRTIPIKLQLSDYNGNAITSLSAVTSLQIFNSQGVDVLNGQGLAGLSVNGSTYSYNWQTKGLPAGQYTISVTLADGTAQTKTIQLTAGGSSAGLVTDGSGGTATAGALLGGEVDLYVDNSNGDLTSDELARIQDAVNAVDTRIAPYGVVINAVTDPAQANVTLNMNTTSSLGGTAQGVLGCTTDADQVTMIQGWNWYAGSDPTQVGAGQYDFETAVMHELGHVLGLGHSSNSSSVMYASLATGTANRVLTTADLNVPDNDSGPCALHAAPAAPVSSRSNTPSMAAPSSTSVPNNGSPISAADQLFANYTLVLNEMRNGNQSTMSSVAALWQSIDALALQRLDLLLSMEAGAMGMSKDSLMSDPLFSS